MDRNTDFRDLEYKGNPFLNLKPGVTVSDYQKTFFPASEKMSMDAERLYVQATADLKKDYEVLATQRIAYPENLTDKPTGTKFDHGKVPMELLSAIALTRVAEVLEFGARKYDQHNWRKGLKWSRVAGAAMRHLIAWLGGEDKDPESGLSHLAHCACCLFFLLEYETTKPELDDRYKENK